MFPIPEGGSGNPFLDMLKMLAAEREKSDDDFDELGPLSESDKAVWKSIHDEYDVLRNQAKELEGKKDMLDGKRKLFWMKLENDTGIYDKNMRITDDYRLLIEKDKPANRPFPGDIPELPYASEEE